MLMTLRRWYLLYGRWVVTRHRRVLVQLPPWHLTLFDLLPPRHSQPVFFLSHPHEICIPHDMILVRRAATMISQMFLYPLEYFPDILSVILVYPCAFDNSLANST